MGARLSLWSTLFWLAAALHVVGTLVTVAPRAKDAFSSGDVPHWFGVAIVVDALWPALMIATIGSALGLLDEILKRLAAEPRA